MTTIDWVALGFVALSALAGLRRGLVGTALSLGGLVGGAVLGDRLGPHLLAGGAHSPYTPVTALVGAVVGALLLRAAASIVASFARGGLRFLPPLHALDSIGGLLAGTCSGLLIVWVAGAVALEIPAEPGLRLAVQRSAVLRELNSIAPPTTILDALSRIDQLPSIVGPAPVSVAPDPHVLAEPAVKAAEPSVVRVTAEACGLGVEGSGWVADPHLVVTAAHVIAGATGIRVDGRPARVFVLDRRNDVAVLDVPTLYRRPLPFADAHLGRAVALLGYPEDGPFNAQPGRIGATVTVSVNGVLRQVTELSGLVRHGNSGGPALDSAGVVEATVFAARVGSQAGFGIPAQVVGVALARAHRSVSSGGC